jgi:hypothetical protein
MRGVRALKSVRRTARAPGHPVLQPRTFPLYHLFGLDLGFKPYVLKHPSGTTHWWLQHPETGEIMDPTAPQLERRFDYSRGRRAPLRTAQPSRRARELMRRIAAKRGPAGAIEEEDAIPAFENEG